MEEDRLDKLIETGIKSGIKNASMEVDLRQPVMERILAFEIESAKRPRILIFLSYIYTLAASLVSLVLLFKISQYSIPVFQQFRLCTSIMKYALQGVFLFILGCLLIMGLNYWQNVQSARKKI